MTLVKPKTWASGEVLTHTDLNSNFDAIIDKINGQLDSTNITGSSGIANSQLANAYSEMVFTLSLSGGAAAAAEGLNSPVTTFFLLGGIPYDAAGGINGYTALSYSYASVFVTAAGALSHMVGDLIYGTTAQIVAGTADVVQAGIDTTTATTSAMGVPTGVTALTISAATAKFFAFNVSTAGTGFLPTDTFCLSVKIRRNDGHRPA